MMYNRKLLFGLVVASLSLGVLFTGGCDTLGFYTDPADGQGQLTLLLTDAPFPYDLVASADVTVDSVVVQSTDSVRITVITEPQAFNLLDLRNGVTAPLGETLLPADTYSMIRLYVSNPSVTLKSGETFDLKVPSGAQSGIKVLVDSLAIQDGYETTLTLDFDLENSFVVQGNPSAAEDIRGFIFKPVVHPLRLETSAPTSEEEGDDAPPADSTSGA